MFLWSAGAADGLMVTPEYHSRVWTLCERIQRGRGAGLHIRDFLSGATHTALATAVAEAIESSADNAMDGQESPIGDLQPEPESELEPQATWQRMRSSTSELRLVLSSRAMETHATNLTPQRKCQRMFLAWQDLVKLLVGTSAPEGVVSARNVAADVAQSLSYVAETLDYMELLMATQFDEPLCEAKLKSMSPRIRAEYSEDRATSISEYRAKQAYLFHLECIRDYPYEVFKAVRPPLQSVEGRPLLGGAANVACSWSACCDGLRSLIEGLLSTPLAEAQHDGYWLLRFLSSYSVETYDAWDKADLLNALVTAELLNGSNYEEIAAAAVRALRATGVETAMPLLIHSVKSRIAKPNSAAPSYHISHFTPVNFCVPVNRELTLRQWLENVQELMRRWRCCGSLVGLAYRIVAFEIPDSNSECGEIETTASATTGHDDPCACIYKVVAGAAGAASSFYDWNFRKFIHSAEEDLFEALVDRHLNTFDSSATLPGASAKSKVVANPDGPSSSPDSSLALLLGFEFHTAAESTWIASAGAAVRVNVELRLHASTWRLHSIKSEPTRCAESVTPTDQLVPLVTAALSDLLVEGEGAADRRLQSTCVPAGAEPPDFPLLRVNQPPLADPPELPPQVLPASESALDRSVLKWKRVSAGAHGVYVPITTRGVQLRRGDNLHSIHAEFAFGPDLSYQGPIAVMNCFRDKEGPHGEIPSSAVQQQQDLSGLVAIAYRRDPNTDPDYIPVVEMSARANDAGAVGLIVVNAPQNGMLRASGDATIPVVVIDYESGGILQAAGCTVRMDCFTTPPSLVLPGDGVVTECVEDSSLTARLLDQLGATASATDVRAQHGIPTVLLRVPAGACCHRSTSREGLPVEGPAEIAAAFAFGPPLERWSGSAWEKTVCTCAGRVVAIAGPQHHIDPAGIEEKTAARALPHGSIALVELPKGVQSWAEGSDVTWRWFRDSAAHALSLGANALVIANGDSNDPILPMGTHSRHGVLPTVCVGAASAERMLQAEDITLRIYQE